MNVGEMINRVRLEVHTDVTDAQIVSRFNELAKLLFRKFPLPEKLLCFTTTELPYYVLPEDCSEDSVYNVIIEGVEYLKVDNSYENPPANFCTVVLGNLFIYPNPASDVEAYLNYRPRPIPLSATRPEVEPNFVQDFHGLYVYDACAWVSGIMRDIDMKNNFENDYNKLERLAKEQLVKFGIKRVKESTIW